MVVELRTLRVSAEMDAGKYAAGARQKADADRDMVAAGQAVVNSLSDVTRKIDTTVTGYSKMERTYVTGAKEAHGLSTAINNLSRMIDKQGFDATRTGQILDGIYRKYGLMADAAALAARGHTQLASAVEMANSRFEKQLALRPANQNIGGGSMFGAMAGAQFQDTLVTAMMGQNPLTIGMQQGMQLGQLMQMQLGGQGALGAVRALGAGIASLVSPINLVSIALTAGGAAAIQYFSSVKGDSEQTTEALEKQREVIADVAKRWGMALPSLKAYNDERERLKDMDQRTQATNAFSGEQWKDLRKELDPLRVEIADIVSQVQGAGAESGEVLKLQNAFKALAAGVKDGTGSMTEAKQVQDDLWALYRETGIPALLDMSKKYGDLAKSIDDVATATRKAREENERLNILRGLPPLVPLNPVGSAGGGLTADPQELMNERARQLANQDPKILSNGRYMDVPVPTARPNIELEGLPGASTTANAYRDMIKSARDRIDQLNQEAEVSKRAGTQAERLRFEMDLLQKAQDKGRSITADQRAEIGKLADEYERAATAAAKAKLSADIQWQTDQLYRTPQEQAIAERLRSAGLPVDLQSGEAGQIRSLLQQQQLKSEITGFFTDFRSALVANGGDIGKAFGQSLANAMLNEANKLWDQLFDHLASSITQAFLGTSGAPATGSGGIVGALLSGTRIAANDNGSITGGMSAYATAIKAIESSGGNYSALGPVTASGDRAYGAYQVMGANIPSWTRSALGYSMTPTQFLGSQSAQDSVFNHQFGLSLARYGNPQDAASVWFTGRPMVTGGAARDILGTTGTQYVEKFNKALGGAAGELSGFGQGLNQLGTGMGQIGQTLSTSFFPAAPSPSGGGFLSSIFGGLFGRGVSAFAGSAQVQSILSTGAIGLFADGTDSAPGGLAIVGERGRELVNLPRGSQVVPNHRTEAMLTKAGNSDGGKSGDNVLHVHISGANGDEHVRKLVQQGVQEGLVNYSIDQKRGGLGQLQARFNSQKN